MLLGQKAPLFKAPAIVDGQTVNDFSLDRYLGEKYVLLFFYPADFSGLCPTEILAFQERRKDFEALGVEIVGCSTDSKFVHERWLNTPVDEGGIEGVNYPLISDKSMVVAMKYDVLAGHFTSSPCNCGDGCCCKESDDCCKDGKKENCDCGCEAGIGFEGFPMAYRATFLIDKNGVVRHQSINEFAMGRDIEEYIRLVEGVQLIDQTGGACPANWKKNK